MYTNPQDVRDLLGVDPETAEDSLLEEFIENAMVYVREYIQIPVIDEELPFDGTQSTFSTKFKYWADISGDTSISTLDFKVYGWTDAKDPTSRVVLTVSKFDPLRGFLVLSSPPSTSVYQRLTIDYSYYTKAINWDLLSLATAWKAAELWVKREEFLVPDTWSLGGLRISRRRPWEYFEVEFNRAIDKLITLPMDKVTYSKLVFRPRGKGPEVETASSEEIKGLNGG